MEMEMEGALQRIVEQRIVECDGKIPDLCNLNLTQLPDNLPKNLQILYCTGNKLTKLPDNLPGTLRQLWCLSNEITVGYKTLWYLYDNNVFLFENQEEYKKYISIYNRNKTKQIVKIQRFYKTHFYKRHLQIIQPMLRENYLKRSIMSYL